MLIQQELANYLNRDFICSCGRTHRCDIKDILLKKGAIKQVVTLLHKHHCLRPLIVCDETTYEIAGKQLDWLFDESSIKHELYCFPCKTPVADMESCLTLERNLPRDTDLILAVGSGTINDICRFVSFQKKLNYMIFATAPSMDGFASDVSPLIVDNLKTTYSAHVPTAIIGDIDILKDAPMEMIAAGAGDVFGKYTCLCDWKLAHLVTGEYYCEEIAELVERSIEVLVKSCKQIQTQKEEAVKNIMEGLILSGIAMSFAGNSRPASGSEHHLSHYWEMMFLFDGKKAILHGTKVGIGTVLVLRLYELFQKEALNFEEAQQKAQTFDREKWNEQMKELYRTAAGGVLELEDKIGKNTPEHVIKRLAVVKEKLPEIKEEMKKLPAADEVAALLHTIHAPFKPEQIGVSDIEVRNAVTAAKELRNRYGLLQLLYDFGLIETYAEKAAALSKEEIGSGKENA